MQDFMTLRWTVLLTRGLIGVGFGVLAMAWPEETVTVLVVLWGCWALVDGIAMLLAVRAVPGTAPKVVAIVAGAVALLIAFFAIARPGIAAATITWFIGVWLVVRGVLEIVEAFSTDALERAVGARGRWCAGRPDRRAVHAQPRQRHSRDRVAPRPARPAVGLCRRGSCVLRAQGGATGRCGLCDAPFGRVTHVERHPDAAQCRRRRRRDRPRHQAGGAGGRSPRPVAHRSNGVAAGDLLHPGDRRPPVPADREPEAPRETAGQAGGDGRRDRPGVGGTGRAEQQGGLALVAGPGRDAHPAP